LAALLSKSVTATLPVVLLLVVLALRGRIPLRSALCILPLLAIGVLSGLWTAYLEQTTVGATGQDWEHSLPERLLIIAPRAYLTYFQKTIVPWPLVFIYPRWEVMAGAWLLYASLVLTIVLFVAAVVVARRGWPTPLLLLVFSAVTLAPALGVVNVYPHRFSFVADHFAYLGILGFLALLTILGVHYVGRLVPAERQRTLGGGLAALVLVVLGSLTYLHSLSFHDARRLWEHTVRMNPGAWIGWLNLGMMDASDGKLDSALAHFEKAAENPDGRASAFGSTGLVLTRAGRLDEAVTAYRLAVEADPRSAKAFAGLGGALSAAGRMDEAEAALQRGLELDPLNDALHVNLGILRYKQERYAEAEASLRRALELEPRGREGRRALAETLRKLGRTDEAAEIARAPAGASPASPTDAAERVRALYDRGRYADALQACQDALRDWPQDRRLLLELAWMRATCPDDAIRSAREAARIIMPLARGNKPEQQRDPRVLDTLACALAASGDFANAIRTAELAAQHARGQNRAELVAEIDARIGLFRNNTPYRHQPR
jgi:Tfp pilus assembly protein PilF